MSRVFAKAYDPKTVEGRIYRAWERSGFFNPDRLPRRSALSEAKGPSASKPFTIIMPPPNANGALHIGHAVFVTLQDIMIRFWRMRGRKALWLPGADHAGFETQVVFDKKLEKEGRSRADVPRDQLYNEMLAFTLENKKIMEGQLRKLGASCDWSRNKFTLDPDIVKIVTDTFVKLYQDGLLYRGERIVNWCVKHQTTLSDLEIKYEERQDPLYYITYGPLTLATVRPETKFGDTAVAVHPRDKRYRQYIGKDIEIETLIGPAKIKVITDAAVDPKFGTGVIKVTPAHDPADFEIGRRHNLEVRSVIGKDGRLNEKTGPYAGLKVMEARKKVAEDMEKRGLLVKVEPGYTHNVAVCYKCGELVEPLVMPQWFLKMTEPPKPGTNSHDRTKLSHRRSLRDMAVEAVKSGKIRIIPKRYEKVFFHWMANLRDWNISRQIVWGIRTPAWFRGDELYVGRTAPKGSGWIQDLDVLDTWFSSGQWPYATLMASRSNQPPATSNQQTKTKNQKLKTDFDTFYPTDVMETGYDILFFWVARMIMLGLYATGKVPFRTVYLHGLVRDKDRQKMSKSKGNVIDPLGVAELYGTDAVRMALVIGNTAGNDIIISEEKIRGYRNFVNKLWNIQRFITLKVAPRLRSGINIAHSREDKLRLAELAALVKLVTTDIEHFRFHHAAEALYHYVWHTFADKIIESAKPRLASGVLKDRLAARSLLVEIHSTLLKLLHPFMPFITEELWADLRAAKAANAAKGTKGLLMVEPWPHG